SRSRSRSTGCSTTCSKLAACSAPATPPPAGVVASGIRTRGPCSRMPALPRLRSGALLLAAVLAAGCAPPVAPEAASAQAGSDVLPIGAIQGRGEASPLLDRTVTVEGVVTGNFARHLGGWFVQDAGDGDPATSDGLFVVSDLDPGLRAGDRVRLRGRVVELGQRGRGTLTTLQAEAIEVAGRGEVAPVVLTAPPVDWEHYEGMRVRIEAPLAIGGQHQLARRGVLHASFGGRLATPTELAAPGPGAARVEADKIGSDTSELQSREKLVCRLLLEKKKT